MFVRLFTGKLLCSHLMCNLHRLMFAKGPIYISTDDHLNPANAHVFHPTNHFQHKGLFPNFGQADMSEYLVEILQETPTLEDMFKGNVTWRTECASCQNITYKDGDPLIVMPVPVPLPAHISSIEAYATQCYGATENIHQFRCLSAHKGKCSSDCKCTCCSTGCNCGCLSGIVLPDASRTNSVTQFGGSLFCVYMQRFGIISGTTLKKHDEIAVSESIVLGGSTRRLVAKVCHRGLSISSGHWLTYFRIGSECYVADNQYVHSVTLEQFLSPMDATVLLYALGMSSC